MKSFVALALLAAGTTAQAQSDDTAHAAHEFGIAAQAVADEADINAALDAVYAAISGPVGEARDWDAMRALFTPDARLTAITPNGLRGGTVQDYIDMSGEALVTMGFTETALVNRIDVYGDLAQAWSSYEGHFTTPDGNPGHVRGINSFQLVRQKHGKWLVQSIFWQAETPDNPLPADMDKPR